MALISIKPERAAQLEEFAKRRGQDTTAALDEALAEYFEWEAQDSKDAVARIRQGYADVVAGRTRPALEMLSELRRKHEIPG